MRYILAHLVVVLAVASCSGGGAGPALSGSDRWHGLVVAPENRCSIYDRSDYPYPQSVEAEIVARDGLWSPYDDTRFHSRDDSQIEHVVALSEAHDSGLCGASAAVRAAFARDLDNLVLATPKLNREKSGKDAAEWLPDRRQCWFVETVIAVRQEYALTIDPVEADAIDRVMAGCS